MSQREIDPALVSKFVEAVNAGELYAARLLLEKGASPNLITKGNPILSVAAHKGHESLVELLLNRGADVNARGLQGRTALFLAASKGRESVISLLLDAGADPNIEDDDGWTALMAAAYSNSETSAKILLDRGADARVKNLQGQNEPKIGSSKPEPHWLEKLLSI